MLPFNVARLATIVLLIFCIVQISGLVVNNLVLIGMPVEFALPVLIVLIFGLFRLLSMVLPYLMQGVDRFIARLIDREKPNIFPTDMIVRSLAPYAEGVILKDVVAEAVAKSGRAGLKIGFFRNLCLAYRIPISEGAEQILSEIYEELQFVHESFAILGESVRVPAHDDESLRAFFYCNSLLYRQLNRLEILERMIIFSKATT